MEGGLPCAVALPQEVGVHQTAAHSAVRVPPWPVAAWPTLLPWQPILMDLVNAQEEREMVVRRMLSTRAPASLLMAQ